MNWLKFLLMDAAAGIILALLLRRFVCLLVFVKGRSMMDTLQNGEVLFALRKNRRIHLRRFDIVLCRYPGRKGLFVKRVIGLPGETIAVTEDVLYINGLPEAENFPRRRHLRDLQERTVPEKSYFLMGDNRPASSDSRRIGAIAEDEIVAVAKYVVFPFGKRRKIG